MMVQITTSTRAVDPTAGYSANSPAQGTPQIHVHFVHRDVFGNGIGIRSYGEIKIAAGEFVWAYELKLNTLQVIVLTPELSPPQAIGYTVDKAIWHKGEYDNYASISVWDTGNTWQGAGTGPVDGSIWLNYIALGE